MPLKFSKGALVWVRHPVEAWTPGTVGEILPHERVRIFYADDKDEVVKVTEGHPLLRTISCDGDIQLSTGEDEDGEDIFSDDLTKMTQLITPAVLHFLNKAYARGNFYSKLGSGTVLAVNPFKEVSGLFTLKTIQSYHSVSLTELQDLPAHVYATAQSALVTLRSSVGKVNQSIIVSGESGAGKTWTVRCLMRYLAEVGIEYKRRLSSTDTNPSGGHCNTPLRASIKSTIHEVQHPCGRTLHHLVRSGSGDQVTNYEAGDERVMNPAENKTGVQGAKVSNEDEACGEKVDLGSTSAEKVKNLVQNAAGNEGIGLGSIVDDRVHSTTETSGKQSSSFEEISVSNLNLNLNNNIGTEAMDTDTQTQQGPDVRIVNFQTDSSQDVGSEDEIFESCDGSQYVLVDMESAVEDLNTSVKIIDRIERRILHSNPILEAFGNAHTLRNENSSRFGKYIQLQYDRSGTIVGAQLHTYLLEKTRAVRHDPGERSYHIFYQMLHGATAAEIEEWKLSKSPFPEDVMVVEDKEFERQQKSDFMETRTSMLRIGISEQTQIHIFKLLSGVLHLRQLTFEGSDDLQNPCSLKEENQGNKESLGTAAQLLGVKAEDIMKVITFREITAHSGRRKSVYFRPSTVEECTSRRDSLVKLIYEVLFHWIVQRVGESVCAPKGKWCSFIGLLDVYGFESFKNNSLEQLCINYANEKLQQHFVSSFLKEQQEEYSTEGVSWTSCDLTDNAECLLSLEAPRNSLFSLLNEECRLNRARADTQLKNRVETMFKSSRWIIQPRISAETPSFSVVHYAGQVSYRTEDLIEKNKDEVPAEISQLLAESENQLVSDLIGDRLGNVEASEVFTAGQEAATAQKNKGKHRPTVLTRFKDSLDDLLDTLASTDCRYIRCVKPNKQSVADLFDAKFVLGQLEACGVVETIRVCSPVHPNKMSYKEFLRRYRFLLRMDDGADTLLDEATREPSRKKRRRGMTNNDMTLNACERILKVILHRKKSLKNNGNELLQYGKTKIFLSSALFESLESLHSDEIVKCAVTVQQAWCNYARRKSCRALRKKAIAERSNAAAMVQRAWKYSVNLRKSRVLRKQLIAKRHASAKVIQRSWMLCKVRSIARVDRKAMIQRRKEAAVCIQSVFRGWRIRYKYKDLMDAWRQLRLLPEKDYRGMVQRRLRLLIGQEPAMSPSPSYEAIRATFQMPQFKFEMSEVRPDALQDGYEPPQNALQTLEEGQEDTSRDSVQAQQNTPQVTPHNMQNLNKESLAYSSEELLLGQSSNDIPDRLTVYYADTKPKQRVNSKNVVLDDLEPQECYLPQQMLDSSLHSRSLQSRTSTTSHQLNVTNSATHDSFESERLSSIQDRYHSTASESRAALDVAAIECPQNSRAQIRHAKLVRSASNPEKFKEQRSNLSPKFPQGPGIIYVWHHRAVISAMISKRPLSLSSDPMAMLEMQYNRQSSILTTPFAAILSPKRFHRPRKVKHRHGYQRRSRSIPPLLQTFPFTYGTWSPGQFYPRITKSGSNCILKYADVPPKAETGDGDL